MKRWKQSSTFAGSFPNHDPRNDGVPVALRHRYLRADCHAPGGYHSARGGHRAACAVFCRLAAVDRDEHKESSVSNYVVFAWFPDGGGAPHPLAVLGSADEASQFAQMVDSVYPGMRITFAGPCYTVSLKDAGDST